MNVTIFRHGQTAGNKLKRYIGTTDEPLSEEGARAVVQSLAHANQTDGESHPQLADEKAIIGQSKCEKSHTLWILSPMLRCLQTAGLLLGLPLETVLEEGTDRDAMIKLLNEHVDRLHQLHDDAELAGTADQLYDDTSNLETGICIQIEEGLRECDFGEFENKNYLELSDNANYQAWIDSNGTLPFPGGESPEGFRARTIACFDKCKKQALAAGEENIIIVAHGGTVMSILEKYGRDADGNTKSYYEWGISNGGSRRFEVTSDWDGKPFVVH